MIGVFPRFVPSEDRFFVLALGIAPFNGSDSLLAGLLPFLSGVDGGNVLSNSSGLRLGPNDILFLSDFLEDPRFLRMDGVPTRSSFSGVFSFCFVGVGFDDFSWKGDSFSSGTAAEFLLSFFIDVFNDSPADGVLGLPCRAFSGVCKKRQTLIQLVAKQMIWLK